MKKFIIMMAVILLNANAFAEDVIYLDELPEAVAGDIIIEDDVVLVANSGKNYSDVTTQVNLPQEASEEDIRDALIGSECEKVEGDASIGRSCGSVSHSIEIIKKLVDHDLSFFAAGGVDPDRRFSRYGLGGLNYLGAWNFSEHYSFLFGADIIFAPMQGAGNAYYVEFSRKNKGVLGILAGMRYLKDIVKVDVLLGTAFAHTIEYDSVPVKLQISVRPMNFEVAYIANFTLWNKDFENLDQRLEALYSYKFLTAGPYGSVINSNHDLFGWQWGYSGGAIIEYYFSHHFPNQNVGKDWGSVRLEGGLSSFGKWIGRTQVQFMF